MTIIATLKDLHLTLFASKTPKGIPFSQYIVALPLNFIIKQDKDKQFKIYIELNNLIFLYDEKNSKNSSKLLKYSSEND